MKFLDNIVVAGSIGVGVALPSTVLSNALNTEMLVNLNGIAWEIDDEWYVAGFQNANFELPEANGLYLKVAQTNKNVKVLTWANDKEDIGTILGSGNVGIGTVSPSGLFQVVESTYGPGWVATNGTVTLTGTLTEFLNTFKVGDTITVDGETVRTIATIVSDTVLTASAAFSTTEVNKTYTLTGGTRFTILGNGNIGIGTDAAASKLSINGGLHVGGDSNAGDNNLLVDGTVTVGSTLVSAAGLALIDDANAAAQLVTLGALPLAGGTMTGNLVVGGLIKSTVGASGASSYISGLVTESNTHQYWAMYSPANSQLGIVFFAANASHAGIVWDDGSRGNILGFSTAYANAFTIGNNGWANIAVRLCIGSSSISPHTALQIEGPIATKVVAKTASHTVDEWNSVLTSDATAGAVTFTLPTAVGITGRRYTFKRIDASAKATIIDGAGSETIDGATTKTLGAQWSALSIVSNGANWLIESQLGTIS